MNHQTTFNTYAIGFGASLLLTALAFFLAAKHVETGHLFPPHPLIIYLLLGIAVLQFVIQLIFFLHLGMGSKQRLNLAIFISTISVVLIIVIGSIWIMNHLNYNMTPQEMNQYMHKQG